MAIITLLSDFGEKDHYQAAVKAKILSINPNITIVDISHDIGACDIAHGAFVLQAVYKDFPEGTVHIIAVDSVGRAGDKFFATELENHFFIGTDNGFIGLISNKTPSFQVDINSVRPEETTFPAKEVFAPAAAKLASNTSIQDLGPPLPELKRMLGRHVKANKSIISGHVIRVDHYGNLISNIDKSTFDILSKQKAFNIIFGRENARRINHSINQVDAGDIFVIFNELGFLEIGINQGKASDLLGLGYDSPVMIKFDE
ncbi:MAG: SAM-dependent chlorinase/fluorinase [Bacteroidota bacterium]